MRTHAVRRVLTRRLHALETDLPAALEHDVEALHRSRVASRRLREALPVIGGGSDERRRHVRKTRHLVRDLTRALGGVREIDVALALLDEIEKGHHDLSGAIGAARAAMERERAGRREEMARRLADIKPARLTRKVSSLVDATEQVSATDSIERLRRRIGRRADRLERTVEAAGGLYAFDRLHLVRIATKKLRYALELAQEPGGVRTLRLTQRLRQVQDLLGRLHDLEVVAGFARGVTCGASQVLASEAEGLLALIERETRVLHADYLARTRALAAVIAACRDSLDRRLATVHRAAGLS
jgi:CHAD domain-containing protein